MTEDIRVNFVIRKDCKNESECSEEMQLAFVSCEQHRGGGLQARWIQESEYNQFDGLTKKDVFVLNEFAGEIFDKLRKTKCLLIGPRCLSCCLTEGTPIPLGSEPVFTIAMRGLVVTASGLTKQQKEKVKRKVEWMGGMYTNLLTDDTTHLVSNTVLSDKYIIAAAKGIPIMSESWLPAVWEASLQQNINGSSKDFESHRLPPFANLQVTTSGLSKKEKQNIMKVINDNGGNFSGAFQSEATDVVVLNKEGIGSEKYKAALEYSKACVTPKWAFDSAQRGVCLPLSKYTVGAGASTSSPLSTQYKLPDMSLNFSRITNIRPNNFIDETKASDLSVTPKLKISQDVRKSVDTVDKDVAEAFDSFDMTLVKKAGPVFDGFNIWVTGPDGAWREKACAIISRGGGVRYECPHERVTHIVAGSAASSAAARAVLPTAAVVNPAWIIDSVLERSARDEAKYLYQPNPSSPAHKTLRPQPEISSPMSKRNLQLLRRQETLDLPPPDATIVPDDLVNHYKSQTLPEDVKGKAPNETTSSRTRQPDLTDDLDEPTEPVEQIFRGLKIEVQGLEEEAVCEIGAEVSAAGGCLVAAGAGGSHVLVPLEGPDTLLSDTAITVTVFWIKDCLSQQELLPVEYYHKPVSLSPSIAEDPPLAGVVASLSTYSGVERAFLDELAKLLGAVTQLRFCRRTTATAQASTHLICPSPAGDKYLGALKWGLPAVRGEWLLECARAATRVSEEPYLIGDTKAPQPSNINQENTTTNQSNSTNKTEQNDLNQDKPINVQTDKENNVATRMSLQGKTPRNKLLGENESEMSPASRYIAMARQGLLGDSQETPKRIGELRDEVKQDGDGFRTPPLDDALSTPNLKCLSPTTRRRLTAIKKGEAPSGPINTPADLFKRGPETPDSGFGAALRPGSGKMSPESRKRLWSVVNQLPHKEPEKKLNTPLSEIRNRFLAQFNSDVPTPPADPHNLEPRKLKFQEQVETPPPAKIPRLSDDKLSSPNTSGPPSVSESVTSNATLPPAVHAQLQRLSAALDGMSSPAHRRRHSLKPAAPLADNIGASESEPAPESQPNTVGWDDSSPAQRVQTPVQTLTKKFMLSSNVDNREEIAEMIKYLGGTVCESSELDAEATHLLCTAPSRSEKMLGSIAAGKWVLHPAYVADSRQKGNYLDEEDYEWGNPRASCLPAVSGSERSLAAAAYRWRSAAGRGAKGPYDGEVALLHVPPARRRLLARLVTAGGGLAPEIEPPYNDESVTVCFADVKRYPLSERDKQWMISHKIPVCAPVLLSSYLTEETRPNPKDHCLPEFKIT